MFGSKNKRRERRKRERRLFQHYIQFKNDATGELVGSLADISLGGFRLEGLLPVQPAAELRFRVDMPPDIPGKGSVVLTATSRWVQRHQVDPRLHVSGYQIVDMGPDDRSGFEAIYERYGMTSARGSEKFDYVWKD